MIQLLWFSSRIFCYDFCFLVGSVINYYSLFVSGTTLVFWPILSPLWFFGRMVVCQMRLSLWLSGRSCSVVGVAAGIISTVVNPGTKT